MEIALLVVVLFVPSFAALWTAVVYLVAVSSGWRKLAERYAAAIPHVEHTYSCVTATMNRGDGPRSTAARYRSTLIVELSPDSLGLKTSPLFRLGHRPLRIPWCDISACRTEPYLFGTRSILVVREPRIAIAIYGEPGKATADYGRRQNPALA